MRRNISGVTWDGCLVKYEIADHQSSSTSSIAWARSGEILNFSRQTLNPVFAASACILRTADEFQEVVKISRMGERFFRDG
jgi:hypothetical protein